MRSKEAAIFFAVGLGVLFGVIGEFDRVQLLFKVVDTLVRLFQTA